uniref:Uncharacterized protein n=1 Tax=Anguilla anguilla TaxID=7936 RepID=A0A0E9VBW3_ANGAN
MPRSYQSQQLFCKGFIVIHI